MVLLNIHSHLYKIEIIGILGGIINEENKSIKISNYFIYIYMN